LDCATALNGIASAATASAASGIRIRFIMFFLFGL
jgi:hypothetical protein